MHGSFAQDFSDVRDGGAFAAMFAGRDVEFRALNVHGVLFRAHGGLEFWLFVELYFAHELLRTLPGAPGIGGELAATVDLQLWLFMWLYFAQEFLCTLPVAVAFCGGSQRMAT